MICCIIGCKFELPNIKVVSTTQASTTYEKVCSRCNTVVREKFEYDYRTRDAIQGALEHSQAKHQSEMNDLYGQRDEYAKYMNGLLDAERAKSIDPAEKRKLEARIRELERSAAWHNQRVKNRDERIQRLMRHREDQTSRFRRMYHQRNTAVEMEENTRRERDQLRQELNALRPLVPKSKLAKLKAVTAAQDDWDEYP